MQVIALWGENEKNPFISCFSLCNFSQGTSAQPSPLRFGLEVVWPQERIKNASAHQGLVGDVNKYTRLEGATDGLKKRPLLKGPGQQGAAKGK